MADLTLKKARKIIDSALSFAHDKGMKPLGVIVLDARGALKAAAIEDGSSLMRHDIAFGKAFGAVSMGLGSRSINKMAGERPHFVSAAVAVSGNRMVPVPGGVLIRDAKGNLLGAVGISGDTSDNDEAAAVAGIAAAGLVSDPGSN